jgi:hypothetical protein
MIFDLGDTTNVQTVVATTYDGANRPEFFTNNPDFEVKLNIHTNVIFRQFEGENSIIIFYRNGNYFVISNHIGMDRFSFVEWIDRVQANIIP